MGARGWRLGAWFLVGAGYAVGVLGISTIGVLVLVPTVVATILLARRPASRSGLPAVVGGLPLPLLYVAYLNRGGPGNVCTSTFSSHSCTQESNPWLWLAAALILLAAAVAIVAVLRRRATTGHGHAGGV